MKIGVYSDARLPTSYEFPGHGLGKMALTIAEGLSELGHIVDLYACPGSKSCGSIELITEAKEEDFYKKHDPSQYDVVIDNGHYHGLGRADVTFPVINVSHDREQDPGINAVFVSEAHGKYWGRQHPTVVHNGINTSRYEYRERTGNETYLAFLAAMFAHKGVRSVLYAGRRTGRPVYLAGPGSAPTGGTHVGPVSGDKKANFLRNSFCLLVPASLESGGLTLLEAAALGVPTVAFALGGLPEHSAPYNLLAQDIDDLVAKVGQVEDITQKQLLENRNWVASCRSAKTMTRNYEQLCIDILDGKRW